MFEIVNPPNFKYYPHFIALYAILIIGSIVFKVVKKKLTKDKRKEIIIVRNLSSWFFWLGLFGFILLGSRYASLYYLSMEFLHIVILAILGAVIAYFGWRYKKSYKKS